MAVDPPEEAVAHLAAAVAALRGSPGEPSWTDPARWHLTLLFLGTVPSARVAELAMALEASVSAAAPLTLRLAGAGRFGSVRRPQVAWVGLDGDVPALTAVAGGVTGAARRVGLPVEDRPFRPHLTIGRWRPRQPADGALTDRLAGYRGPAWPVREVRLVESHLGPRPRHDLVAAWPIMARA